MKNINLAQQITVQEALLESHLQQWEWFRDKPEKNQKDLQQEGNLLGEISKINDKIDRLKRQQANESNPQVNVVPDHEAWCRHLIEDNGIMFTGKPTVYWLITKKDGDGIPLNFPKDAMVTRHFRLTDRTVWECFEDMLERQGRKFDKVTYSFLPQPSNVLNLMSRANWVQPVEGKPHELFDILLRSLGGGTEEGYEHLRHCLLWKYRHPEDFMLPCPVLYGVGIVRG